MARPKVVPDKEEIKTLPTPLTYGERTLLMALWNTLDDSWTIYVQPHLNGLNPDIVIFSEEAGIGIFEVKDWNLADYHVVETEDEDKYRWSVFDGRQNIEVKLESSKCPFKQAQRYKDSIFYYEIPLLSAETVMRKELYALVVPFVYMHGSSTHELQVKLTLPIRHNQHIPVFGDDKLNPDDLRKLLASKYLRKGSKFTQWIKTSGLGGRLSNALGYPTHGKFDLKYLKDLTPKQRELLSGTPPKRRILGSAGAGKTFVLVHKAVNSALKGKKVLLVCFNIMMATHLLELTTRLARQHGPHFHRNIEVGWYHRIMHEHESGEMTSNRYIDGPIEVLLIDEGQDFRQGWIEDLQKMCVPNYEFIFAEDDRQDIYLTAQRRRKERVVVPGVIGRPNLLSESLRLPNDIAELANLLMDWAKLDNEIGAIEITRFDQRLIKNVMWFDGTVEESRQALYKDIEIMWNNGTFGSPADTAVLVSSVADGWDVWELLEILPIPLQTNFESHSENIEIRKVNTPDTYADAVRIRRREYKVAFRMQTGKLKISTIHSFKGWELDRIMLLFNPSTTQEEACIYLLYTAITRCQNELFVYNCQPRLREFGELAVERTLARRRGQ